MTTDDRQVEEFAQIVDSFAAIMEGADKSVRKSLRYRANLLWVHAIAALCMAPLFALTGIQAMQSPAFYVVRLIPGTPVSVATVLGFGGFILGIGAVFEHYWAKVIGLLCLGLWYVLFGFSLLVPIGLWLADNSLPQPTFYAPVLYFHLTVIMAVHIGGTLRKLKR